MVNYKGILSNKQTFNNYWEIVKIETIDNKYLTDEQNYETANSAKALTEKLRYILHPETAEDEYREIMTLIKNK